MPGDFDTPVTLLVQGRPTTVVSARQLAVALDERQYESGHGACLHVARTEELIEIPDTRVDTRWPDYTRRAAEHGNLSSLAVSLHIDGDAPILPLTGPRPGRRTPTATTGAALAGACRTRSGRSGHRTINLLGSSGPAPARLSDDLPHRAEPGLPADTVAHNWTSPHADVRPQPSLDDAPPS